MNTNIKSRYQQANEEFQALLKWANAEIEKTELKLKAENKYVAGLDTNREAYAYINKELKRKTLELFDKYDLPNKLK